MELLSKSEEEEPLPDIHDLFCHYNSLYFDDALGACIVYWSDSRTTRSAGMCFLQEDGGCEIRLSEPLLKSRSCADLKNTLLHEMIHAFLWITEKKKDHSYHGPGFTAKVKAINSSSKMDHQRPSGGYTITVSHGLRKEVDSCKAQQWICTSCGDMIEGTANKEPLDKYCIEKADDNSCRNSCQWHRHKALCTGKYTKKTNKPGCKDKTRAPDDAQENEGEEPKASPRPIWSKTKSQDVEKNKDISIAKRSKRTIDDATTASGIKSRSPKDIRKKEVKEINLKTHDDALIPKLKIPSRPRSLGHGKECKLNSAKKDDLDKHKEKAIIPGQWFAFYGDEESSGDIKPLVNNRTERRKHEKLLKMKEKFPDTRAIEYNDGSTKAQELPPIKDNIVYIIDDD